jgi:hypothetical protein
MKTIHCDRLVRRLGLSSLLLLAPAAWAQSSTSPQELHPVPGSTGLYVDDSGNTFRLAPQSGSLCDSSGCVVQVCAGGGNKAPCQYHWCTTSGCTKLVSSPSS